MTQVRNKEETRKNILLSAKENFSSCGYHAASVKKIAKDADVNSAMIYYYFDNKRTLWNEVKKNILKKDDLAILYTKIIPDSSTILKKYIEQFIKARYKLYKDNSTRRLVLWESLDQDDEFKLTHVDIIELWQENISILQSYGLVKKDIENDVVNIILINIITSFTINSNLQRFNDKEFVANYIKASSEMIYNYLKG